MKTTVKTADFINALSLVVGSIDKRATNPVLLCFKMEIANNCVTLTGFDLKKLTRISLPDVSGSIGETAVDGVVLLDASVILPLCQKIKTDLLTFVSDSYRVRINGNYHVNFLSADDYPDLPSAQSEEVLHLSSEALHRHLSFVKIAVSKEEFRPVLTGINFSQKGDMIAFAATDGRRLAMAEFESSAKFPSITISEDGISQLVKILKRQDDEVEIKVTESHVEFGIKNQIVISRLLEGTYPNYRQLIPKEFARRVVMDRESVIHALERLAVLAGSRNIVKFSIGTDADAIVLATEGGELGEGQEQIPAKIEGEPLDVAFNVKYVLEGLKAMSTSQVQIQLNTATAPVIFLPLGEDRWTYLVMPIELRK